MLKQEENELLTRVGPGTPMGDLLRQYWIPALFTRELPQPDSDPLRVRLLGEDLIACRDTSGRIDLSVHFQAYPVVERNGVGWVYMGPQNPPPPLPNLEWNLVPEDQVYLSKRVADSNWVQTLEGEIDSSHSGFLHTVLNEEENYTGAQNARFGSQTLGMYYKMKDKHPHFSVLDTEYGMLIGARRNAEEDSYYWRITQFLLPFHTIIPPYGQDPYFSGHAWIPIDDEHTLALCFTYHPTKPLPESQLKSLRYGGGALGHQGLHPTVDAFLPPTSEAWSQYRSIYNKDNDYKLDLEAQRTVRFSGLPGIWPQDSACQESMGAICDRTQEHLGSSDTGIIRARRSLMTAATELREQGMLPPSVARPEVYYVRSASVVLPREVAWVEESREFREARPGVNYAAT